MSVNGHVVWRIREYHLGELAAHEPVVFVRLSGIAAKQTDGYPAATDPHAAITAGPSSATGT